jgi:outer membrane lipoprotein SlyB
MHDWYGIFVGILLNFVALPALVGCAVGYGIARWRGIDGRGKVRAAITGAIIGGALGALVVIVLFRY